ncbi:hypothetical protein [Kribbella sp. HUAS MG21]|uniref:Uncharacterized protein n=1 Tax=Kribbella sp. HUAS MG21 TaxID=3160966 RepID=A0AAU7TEW4_9ACTN
MIIPDLAVAGIDVALSSMVGAQRRETGTISARLAAPDPASLLASDLRHLDQQRP